MELTKIQAQREVLNAYENAIERVDSLLDYELNIISGKYDWANDTDIERAKVRCATLYGIIANLENEALK